MSMQITAWNLKLDECNHNIFAEVELVTKCHRLKMVAENGKKRVTAMMNDTEASV